MSTKRKPFSFYTRYVAYSGYLADSWTCTDCGNIVTDRQLHDKFHKTLDRLQIESRRANQIYITEALQETMQFIVDELCQTNRVTSLE